MNAVGLTMVLGMVNTLTSVEPVVVVGHGRMSIGWEDPRRPWSEGDHGDGHGDGHG